jgi:deoxyhypusine monooxygenase
MWEYENSTDQFNPLDKLATESKAYTTGMERSAHAAVAAGMA